MTVMAARPAGRKEALGPRGKLALWASVSPSVIEAQRGTCDHHGLLWKLPLSSPPVPAPRGAHCVPAAFVFVIASPRKVRRPDEGIVAWGRARAFAKGTS